jgi:beta-lactamase superfamily II metal-dependent hydrolase
MLVVRTAACFGALVSSLWAQGSWADAPVGLTVMLVNVGQGDGIVVRSPSGQIHVIDAGPGGQGTVSMLPAIAALAPLSYGYTFLSHFHEDHVGGLDEVLLALPFQFAIDRGDVNRPSNTWNNNYIAAAGSRRQTVVLGNVYALGGGAVIRCIAHNGQVLGGAFVDPTTSSQEENSRSLVLRLEYGQFAMWFAGDLTGGASGTADVEGPASLACGDVDVYKLNHHGSASSTNLNLVARLNPELCVVSAGVGNSFGHPTTSVVNRLNQAAAARALLATTTGSGNTIGFGVTGTLRIDSDGRRYRATAQNGSFLDFFCDEVQTPGMGVGELVVSEVQRNPNLVPDTNGEYVEVLNVGSKPVGLRGLRLVDGSGAVTVASNYMVVPGRTMLFQVDGAPSRNGGQPLGAALPFGSLSLGDIADTVALTQNFVPLDTLVYNTGFAGGAGIAAERIDALAPASSANFAPAPNVYGLGDRGSPGAANPSDNTAHPVRVGASFAPDRLTLHATALDHGIYLSVLLLAQSDTPPTPFQNAVIPLAFDALCQASLGAPDFVALMPAGGYRSVDVALPQPNPLSGTTLYAAHVILDFNLQVPGLSPALPFVLP